MAAQVSGKTFRLDANPEKLDALSFSFKGPRCTVTIRSGDKAHARHSATDEWVDGTATLTLGGLFPGSTPSPVAIRGAWTDDSTYAMKLCFYETPFVETITCKFSGDQVTVNRKLNVSFGPTERPVLTGRAV